MTGPGNVAPSGGPDREDPGGTAGLQSLKRFVSLYVPLALAWIIGSDLVLAAVAEDLADAVWFSVVKGVLFVVVTAWLLYVATRRALASATQRQALFKVVVEEAPDLILRAHLEPEFGFDYVSPASTALGGYTPDEFYADPQLILSTVHPEDAPRLAELLTNPSPDERVAELRFLHKDDGSVVWTEITLTWEMDDGGRPIGTVAVVRDVTDRYEAQRTAHLLATAVESAGEAVMVTDAEGTIQYVNATYQRMSGYARDELIGQNPRIVKSGRQSARFYARLWSTIKAGGTFRGNFVNRAKDGRLYEQQTTITPVGGESGDITHFVAVARDVTVEREIRRQIAATERAQAMAQLAAGIAHDFRNLLNVVSANVELLNAAGAEGEVQKELTQDIERAAAAGAALVTRLLDVARPARAERELVHLPTLISGMEGLLRAATSHSVSLVQELDEDTLPVHVDRIEIEQALLNLVRNASQAMPDGGRLTIRVGRARHLPAHAGGSANVESFVRIEVEDTGIGMDDEQLSRIYDPFFTTKEAGTGLGVPMVRQAAEAHEGFLEFESELGRGTTATLFLPVAEEELLVEVAASDPTPKEMPGGRERLLVVDDDPGLRRAAERALVHLGYRVTMAENGLEAIRILEEDRDWDAIVTDLIMPALGGDELYRRLAERDMRIPVVFMSGQSPTVARGGSHDWPTTFLQKPWTVESLARAVRSVLDARPG